MKPPQVRSPSFRRKACTDCGALVLPTDPSLARNSDPETCASCADPGALFEPPPAPTDPSARRPVRRYDGRWM